MPEPVVAPGAVRCWRCGKLIARELGGGSRIDCPRCGAENRT